MTFFTGKWKTAVHAPCIIGKRVDPSGPVLVLRDGVWVQFPGPISLEQFYGKTSDPMEWQPSGNHWVPPVSYWTKRERAERLRARR